MKAQKVEKAHRNLKIENTMNTPPKKKNCLKNPTVPRIITSRLSTM